jgi:glycine/D-amino acid oxidase-like deaminating enzyme
MPGAVNEIAILGGGIIGCSAAALAAERGAKVTLVERSEIGAGASGRNLGAVQHPFDAVLAPLYDETLETYRALSAAQDGFDFPAVAMGLLIISDEQSVVETMRTELAADLSGVGDAPRTDLLAPRQVQSLEPSLADDLWGLRVDTGYPIPPHAATQAMAERARAAGADLRLGVAAVPAVRHGQAQGLVLEGGQPLRADVVLIAAGPWSPFLLDPAGRWRPIVATWGATAQLELANAPRHVVEEARVQSVNQPAQAMGDGRVPAVQDIPSLFTIASATPGTATIGSTFLPFEPNHREMAPELVDRGRRYLPSLAGARITATRACARPQSVDGHPLLGPIAGVDGLFIAAGHGPWGISTGPASARMVVDAIFSGAAIPDALRADRVAAPELLEVSV